MEGDLMPDLLLDEIAMIKNKASEQGISMFEVSLPQDNLNEISFTRGTQVESINSFFDFISCCNKKFLFFETSWLDEDSISERLIDIDLINEQKYGSVVEKIKKKAQQHNKRIKNLPVNETPATYKFFVTMDGFIYSVFNLVDWSEFLREPDEVLEEITSEYEEEISTFREEKRKTNELLKQNTELEILENATFRNCATKGARVSFIKEFLFKKGVSHLFFRTAKELETVTDLMHAKVKGNEENKK